MKKNFVILGCGNMTSALFSNGAPAGDFAFKCYTPTMKRAEDLVAKIGGEILQELNFKSPDVLFLGHKPQNFSEIAESINKNVSSDTLVISIQAAISVEQIQKKLGTKKVIRLMPNTPVSLKKGVVLFFASSEVSEFDKKMVMDWLNGISLVANLKSEKVFDEATVITGSGPGLIFEIAKTFQKHLLDLGISEKEAQKLVAQTFLGSGQMMLSETDLTTLQNQVTSKNGVTNAALEEWRKKSIAEILKSGFSSAIARGTEIASSLK